MKRLNFFSAVRYPTDAWVKNLFKLNMPSQKKFNVNYRYNKLFQFYMRDNKDVDKSDIERASL